MYFYLFKVKLASGVRVGGGIGYRPIAILTILNYRRITATIGSKQTLKKKKISNNEIS